MKETSVVSILKEMAVNIGTFLEESLKKWRRSNTDAQISRFYTTGKFSKLVEMRRLCTLFKKTHNPFVLTLNQTKQTKNPV